MILSTTIPRPLTQIYYGPIYIASWTLGFSQSIWCSRLKSYLHCFQTNVLQHSKCSRSRFQTKDIPCSMSASRSRKPLSWSECSPAGSGSVLSPSHSWHESESFPGVGASGVPVLELKKHLEHIYILVTYPIPSYPTLQGAPGRGSTAVTVTVTLTAAAAALRLPPAAGPTDGGDDNGRRRRKNHAGANSGTRAGGLSAQH